MLTMGIATLFCMLPYLVIWRLYKKLKSANILLQQVKQETRETAQLSLNNPHPLIHISQDREIIFINPAAMEKFKDILNTGIKHPILSKVNEVTSTLPVESVELEVEYKNSTYHQTITPIQTNKNRSFIIYSYDITKRKAYENKIQHSQNIAEQARKEAENANKARGDFLANMSHELRTPMNGIIGLSDILSRANIRDKYKEMADAIHISSRNLLNLLNDILDFSKIEAGEITIELIPFSPYRMMNQIENLYAPVASKNNIQFNMIADGDLPDTLISDPARLQQILNNLINNAFKFTTKGSVDVTISIKKQPAKNQNQSLEICVSDTGIGIAKEKHEIIFQKFQQADISTTRKYGGTGLGLSITKDLVEIMGGQIHLESKVGEGTKFYINLPVKTVQEKEKTENKKLKNTPDTPDTPIKNIANNNILIVDDHPINLLYMRTTLTDMGIETFNEAENGHEALKLCREQNYDLILLDCQMPDMSGFDVAREIRSDQNRYGQPIIIAVTADAMKGAHDKCLNAGMNDYISKPVEKEKIKAILKKWTPLRVKGQKEESDPAIKTIKPSRKNIMLKQKLENTPLNWDNLNHFTHGDSQIEKEIINIFIQNLEIDIQELENSLYDQNYKRWSQIAHKIYGSCAHIGAINLAHICEHAQELPDKSCPEREEIHMDIIEASKEIYNLLKNRQAA